MKAHFPDRRIEWFAAQVMVSIGVYAAIEPGAFTSSRMSPVLDLVPLWFLCSINILAGTARIAGLYFDLGWWGCQMRAAGALVGFCAWLQMGHALVISCIEAHVPISTQICVYGIFAYQEVRSIKRATDDAHVSIAKGASDAVSA